MKYKEQLGENRFSPWDAGLTNSAKVKTLPSMLKCEKQTAGQSVQNCPRCVEATLFSFLLCSCPSIISEDAWKGLKGDTGNNHFGAHGYCLARASGKVLTFSLG